ncbi:RNA polymerase sigma factor [Oleiharenicola lentus]|uniref:RNA polymerase sigma factor n=1 Tax=Oleiharenicola lentus TaxID=2508720 RepID=UPI003F67D783
MISPSANEASAEVDTSHTKWFEQEVHLHDNQLKAYLRGAFPSVRDVEDVVQESYLRIWKAKLDRPIASTKSFLFQVARHLALDLLRRNRVVTVEDLRDLPAESVMEDRPDAAQILSYHEKISFVAAALAELPPRCREIFVLRKFKGVSQKELAAQFSISERTVESQITRGMRLLDKKLRQRGLDGFSVDER